MFRFKMTKYPEIFMKKINAPGVELSRREIANISKTFLGSLIGLFDCN